MTTDDSIRDLEQAMQHIDEGDVAALSELLASRPALAKLYSDGVAPEHDGRTLLLHVASWPGGRPNAAALAATLAESGSDPNLRFRGEGETPLHWAASNDHDEALVEALLDAGADIEAPGGCVDGGTPLLNAVHYGKTGAVATLLGRGAALCNLRVAAGAGRLDLIQAWHLDDGRYQRAAARLTPSQPGGAEPLTADQSAALAAQAFSCALFCGQYGVADWLLENGVDVNGALGRTTMLHQAAYRGTLPMAMYLAARGADLDAHSAEVPAPAHNVAFAHGNADIMNYLIDQGASLSLQEAAAFGRLDRIVKGYAECKDAATLLVQTVGDQTFIGKPLAPATKRGRVAVARYLQQRDPRLAQRPVAGSSALDRARECGDATLLEILTAAGR